MDIRGHAAIVTGGASGLGAATAEMLAGAGATAKAMAAAKDKHGIARILINCAGVGPAKRIVGRDGPMPLEDFSRVITINLIGTFNAMRLVAAEMQAVAPLQDGERGII